VSTHRTARLALALLAAAALAGCSAGSHAASSGDAGAPSATLPALQTKLRSISLDECATHPPEQIYPSCGRFVREVQNIVPAARAEAGGVPSPDAVTRAADAVDGSVNKFTQDLCITVGGPTGPPAVCGPDLGTMQTALAQLTKALGA
jgi:hypothetical protein